jgi:hypothetical protein
VTKSILNSVVFTPRGCNSPAGAIDSSAPSKSERYPFPYDTRRKKILEARGGIEPPIKVLQTFALPLGDRAFVLWTQPKTKTPPGNTGGGSKFLRS